jgi:stress response protein SCP2
LKGLTMAISLKKGQGVSLKKSDNDLSLVTIGLGWDIKEEKKGFLSGIFSKSEPEYDLDVIAFLCNSNVKVVDVGRDSSGNATLKNGDVIFFNSMRHKSGHIWLTGDNRTGEGDGDDEQIIVKLNDLSDDYSKIVFIVQIYDGINRKQNFGKVKNAYIRAVDNKDKELLRFDLSGGAQFLDCRSMLFAELVRESGGWKFDAIGSPSPSDPFTSWLKSYM